ncbi:hypothetical protein E2C01_097375 [Portunus trituberculatus]|uniref:Uncharacterized protein n=1 Tax=Portunus trituberculatus TaxID=210409 RepID=A0A5B7K4B3_PORTR|nr:hypothetical protein [Portunus trituberculatus]
MRLLFEPPVTMGALEPWLHPALILHVVFQTLPSLV